MLAINKYHTISKNLITRNYDHIRKSSKDNRMRFFLFTKEDVLNQHSYEFQK